MAGKDTFANTATTTLAASITTTGATSVSVVSSAPFPAAVTGVSQFRIRIEDELMIVTNVSGTTWTITRGAEGSTASTHLIAAPVTHIVTAGSLGVLQQIAAAVNASPPSSPVLDDLWLVTDAAPASNKWTAALDASPPSSPATNDLWLVTDKGADTVAPTAGGLVYGDGSNYQVSAAGTAGQVLTSAGTGTPGWTRGPGSNMGAPTNTASTGTPSSAGTEIVDAVLGNYVFTALAGHRYQVVLDNVAVTGSVLNDTYVIRVRNGGASTPTSASTLIAGCSGTIMLVAGVFPAIIIGTFVPGAGTVTLGSTTTRASGTGAITQVATYANRELYAVDLGLA